MRTGPIPCTARIAPSLSSDFRRPATPSARAGVCASVLNMFAEAKAEVPDGFDTILDVMGGEEIGAISRPSR